jgi:predicted HAD superfamily Cof-like phosphohydrolase
MHIFRLTDEVMEAVTAQARTGKNLQQIARELHISVEMAAQAVRQWPLIERMKVAHAY